jgi:hypothetical protein
MNNFQADRRRFLRWLTATAAGAALAPVLDVERMLWIPGEKRIFLPATHVMASKEFGIVVRYIKSFDIEFDELSPARTAWSFPEVLSREAAKIFPPEYAGYQTLALSCRIENA